ELDELKRQERQLLPEMTSERLADVQRKLRNLRELEKTVSQDIDIEGSRGKDPLAMRLEKPLLELWAMAGGREAGLYPLRQTLQDQEKQLKSLLERVEDFGGKFKKGSPNVFRP